VNLPRFTPRVALCAIACSLTALTVLSGASASASAEAGLVYQYNFAGTTGTVTNLAQGGPVLPLTLQGAWTNGTDGVNFTGDTAGNSSIAFGAPPSGYTLSVPATQAMGFGADFVYAAPTTGLCFGDSPNLTQIGRFAANQAQAKIQLSACHDNKTAVFMQCRFAGSKTPGSVLPVTSTLALVGGDEYDVMCAKSPDAAGKATVTFTVTDLSSAGGATTVTNSFTVAALGLMQTNAALSAANKYPLPAPAHNTDQFVGELNTLAYCSGTSPVVASCVSDTLAGTPTIPASRR
jgi:hypothetical protein